MNATLVSLCQLSPDELERCSTRILALLAPVPFMSYRDKRYIRRLHADILNLAYVTDTEVHLKKII